MENLCLQQSLKKDFLNRQMEEIHEQRYVF